MDTLFHEISSSQISDNDVNTSITSAGHNFVLIFLIFNFGLLLPTTGTRSFSTMIMLSNLINGQLMQKGCPITPLHISSPHLSNCQAIEIFYTVEFFFCYAPSSTN